MRKLFSALCAGALALSMAAPAGAQGMGQDTTGLGPGGSGSNNPGFSVARNWRHHHSSGNNHHRGFYNHGGYGWYNGHRGYRHYRHGYREYNGWWFPAAILGGAIIGNAIVNAPRGGSAHVQWCYDHYRSYRASDNTYQPYSGPRRQCASPY
jgi:hypothetical protein